MSLLFSCRYVEYCIWNSNNFYFLSLSMYLNKTLIDYFIYNKVFLCSVLILSNTLLVILTCFEFSATKRKSTDQGRQANFGREYRNSELLSKHGTRCHWALYSGYPCFVHGQSHCRHNCKLFDQCNHSQMHELSVHKQFCTHSS